MRKQYHEVKKHKTGLKRRFWLNIVVLVLFFFVTLICFFVLPILKLANALSVNNYLYEKSYYFVMLNTQTSNKQEASKEAQNIKAKGGAGVLVFNEEYFLVISCYDDETKAKKVCSSLSLDENHYVVEKKTIVLNTKNMPEESKTQSMKTLNFFAQKIEEIYAISNNLDSNQTSLISANLKIRSIKSETNLFCDENAKSESQNCFKNPLLNFFSALEYASDNSHLNSAIIPYSSILRETMAHSILSFCEK